MPTDDKSRKTAKAPPARNKGKSASAPAQKSEQATNTRVKQLFTDIENLAKQEPADCEKTSRKQSSKKAAAGGSTAPQAILGELQVQQELKRLRTRVADLEMQLQETNQQASIPSLYEKEVRGHRH